jgi:hypothetical protein
MSGGSFGLIGNVIVGIVGAVFGSFVFDFLGGLDCRVVGLDCDCHPGRGDINISGSTG